MLLNLNDHFIIEFTENEIFTYLAANFTIKYHGKNRVGRVENLPEDLRSEFLFFKNFLSYFI